MENVMHSIDRLLRYFLDDLDDYPFAEMVGTEIETSFVDQNQRPISVETSQRIFHLLADHGWGVVTTKGQLIAEIRHPDGDRILYELGRQNIELSVAPQKSRKLIAYTHGKLSDLFSAARLVGAFPSEKPIIETDEDLLVIPDERDATWLDLDGREALNLLTKCSAVQFTIDVPPKQAIQVLNNLGNQIDLFLRNYPQDALWRRYIAESKANYRSDRYGGPLTFTSLKDYCAELAKHDVILNGKLVPQNDAGEYDIPLFLRSVWWYFRLRRFGRKLCIEVRPMPRGHHNSFDRQLQMTLLACEGVLGRRITGMCEH